MAVRISPGTRSPEIDLNVLTALDLLQTEHSSDTSRSRCLTGVKSIDAHFSDLFSGGKVCGIARTSEDEQWNLSVPLIVSCLAQFAEDGSILDDTGKPCIYILAPPSTMIISSVHSLLQTGLEQLPPRAGKISEATSSSLLDNVQLLQYLDLPGLAESLSEVSQRLFDRSVSEGKHGSVGRANRSSSILLLQGLGSMLSTTQRRSGVVHTSAILSNLLRTVTHLSRTYADLLVLVDMDVEVGAPVTGISGEQGAGVIESAFSSSTGETMRIVPTGPVGGVVGRGMDIVVCVHDGFGTRQNMKGTENEGAGSVQRVVEVVKDRIGGGFGEWCIWVQ